MIFEECNKTQGGRVLEQTDTSTIFSKIQATVHRKTSLKIFTFVIEQTEISQDEPLPLPETHPRAVLQTEKRNKECELLMNE